MQVSATTLVERSKGLLFSIDSYCQIDSREVLEAEETWTSALRQVHNDISEDVEYVVGHVEWIGKLKELFEAGKWGWEYYYSLRIKDGMEDGEEAELKSLLRLDPHKLVTSSRK